MKVIVSSILLFVTGGLISAQQPPAPPAAPAAPARIVAELSGGWGKAVKNAPFSAEAVTEHVQTLADGNRIVRSSTSKLYRNSEGRFRQEQTGGTGGMFGSFYTFGGGITIMNPGQGLSFTLDDERKIATMAEKVAGRAVTVVTPAIAATAKALEPSSPEVKAEVQKLQAEIDKIRVSKHELKASAEHLAATIGVGSIGFAGHSSKYETRTEDLGEQSYEGIIAKGTRTITTIPAGAIGNERPIETVYEKWYSPELQMVVWSRHTDPRFGEQTYKLTNINRTEPDPSLFKVPSGYKVVSGNERLYNVTTRPVRAAQIERAAAATKGAGTTTARPQN